MKILIDLTSLADNFSGIERYALNISKEMVKQDKKNYYVLVFKNYIHYEFLQYKGRKNIKFMVLKGKNKLIFNQFILLKNLYKIKADKYLFLAFPSPILFRRNGIVNTIHDLTAFLYPKTMEYKSKIYFKYSIKNSVRVSEKIITVSQSSKNDIIKKFKIKNIHVIYNGISEVFKNFKYNQEKNNKVLGKYGLKSGYLMSLGTLEPRKNLIVLLKAYNELSKDANFNDELVLVGRLGWKFNEFIKNSNNEILKEKLKFTGFVEDEDLPYIYINSKLFIFPSIYEGFGIPIIEAAQLNIPIIVSNIPSSIEVTGGNAIFFETNNANSLKKVLLDINTQEKLLKIKNNRSILEYIKKYNWNVQAKRLIEIIR